MPDFNSFWSIYPRRVAKQAAMKAYDRALKSTTPEKIDEAARRYAHDRKLEDPKFTKHPATWLNGGCWADYDLALSWVDQKKPSAEEGIPEGWRRLSKDELEARDAYWRKTRGISAPWSRAVNGWIVPQNAGWWFPSAMPPVTA